MVWKSCSVALVAAVALSACGASRNPYATDPTVAQPASTTSASTAAAETAPPTTVRNTRADDTGDDGTGDDGTGVDGTGVDGTGIDEESTGGEPDNADSHDGDSRVTVEPLGIAFDLPEGFIEDSHDDDKYAATKVPEETWMVIWPVSVDAASGSSEPTDEITVDGYPAYTIESDIDIKMVIEADGRGIMVWMIGATADEWQTLVDSIEVFPPD